MATTSGQETSQAGESHTPSRAPQVIFICVSIVLLLAAIAYVVIGHSGIADVIARWTGFEWLKKLPPGYQYQVLYALVAMEIVLALYVWGVGPWSDVAAPSGVKKAPPAPPSKAAVTAVQPSGGQSKGQPSKGQPPAAPPPLGPRLTKALSEASDPPPGRSLQGGSR